MMVLLVMRIGTTLTSEHLEMLIVTTLKSDAAMMIFLFLATAVCLSSIASIATFDPSNTAWEWSHARCLVLTQNGTPQKANLQSLLK
jgi:hypothetical protein